MPDKQSLRVEILASLESPAVPDLSFFYIVSHHHQCYRGITYEVFLDRPHEFLDSILIHRLAIFVRSCSDCSERDDILVRVL